MRLLPKNEVQGARALDRHREIEEGKKLATRVDDLRQLEAIEKANLLKFREESLKRVKAEIEALVLEKTSLENEIEAKKVERSRLLIPLDKEWEEIKAKNIEIDQKREQLVQNNELLHQNELIYNQRLNELKTEQERVATERENSKFALQISVKMRDESEQILLETKEKKRRVSFEVKKIEKALNVREYDVAARERDVSNERIVLAAREKALNEERIYLKDERETLQRGFNELKKLQTNEH